MSFSIKAARLCGQIVVFPLVLQQVHRVEYLFCITKINIC